jgi:hypothetical protein
VFIVALMALFFPSALFATSVVSVSLTVLPSTACSDGIDNDGDLKIDYPNDPGCLSSISVSEVDPIVSPPSGGGGGGGGYSSSNSVSPILGTGRAVILGTSFPNAQVVALVDGVQKSTSTTLSNGSFSISVHNIEPGLRSFSVYAIDALKVKTASVSVSTTVNENTVTNISGIVLSPTLSADKTEVKKGGTVLLTGVTAPLQTVFIEIKSNTISKTITTLSNKTGAYSLSLDTGTLDLGSYAIKTYCVDGNKHGPYSRSVGVVVGLKNLFAFTCGSRADVNGDCKVNLVDFSMVAYWYKRNNPPISVDLNGDGKISLADFSILAFNWTG